MKVTELADLIKKYNLEEKWTRLFYQSHELGLYGTTSRGIYINFLGCSLENVFNPIACDCKINNMIKDIKETLIKNKIKSIEKDFENGN